MIKKKIIIYGLALLGSFFLQKPGEAQNYTLSDWSAYGTYYPNPILFVHTINTNAEVAWGDKVKRFYGPGGELIYEEIKPGTISIMRSYFDGLDNDNFEGYYTLWDIEDFEEPYAPYLHTFDYGTEDYSQTFNSIASNAWGEQGNTLQEIVRDTWQAYDNKDVILVAHGMGGLLARYYLRQKQELKEQGKPAEEYQNYVKRLVTLATPHEGTEWANMYGFEYKLANDCIDYIAESDIFEFCQYAFEEVMGQLNYPPAIFVSMYFRRLVENREELTKQWAKTEGIPKYNSEHFLYNWAIFYEQEGVDNLMWNSPFIKEINNKSYPDDIEYVHTIFTVGSFKEIKEWFGNCLYSHRPICGGDLFVHRDSQEGKNVYTNVEPVISYNYKKFKKPWEFSFKDYPYWLGDHFFTETTNIPAVLQGIDGIPQFKGQAIEKETDLPNIAGAQLITEEIGKDGTINETPPCDLVEIMELKENKKIQTDIPQIMLGKKIKLALLVGTKDINMEQTKEEILQEGSEYLPASLKVRMSYMASDTLFTDDALLKNFDWTYDFLESVTLNHYVELADEKKCDTQCYITYSDPEQTEETGKYGYYITRQGQYFSTRKNFTGGEYVYISLEVENPAGLKGKKIFVFRATDNLETDCSLTRYTQGESYTYQMSLDITNKLTVALENVNFYLYVKEDLGKRKIAEKTNEHILLSAGGSYTWDLDQLTIPELIPPDEEDGVLVLEYIGEIEGEEIKLSQDIKPVLNKIVYSYFHIGELMWNPSIGEISVEDDYIVGNEYAGKGDGEYEIRQHRTYAAFYKNVTFNKNKKSVTDSYLNFHLLYQNDAYPECAGEFKVLYYDYYPLDIDDWSLPGYTSLHSISTNSTDFFWKCGVSPAVFNEPAKRLEIALIGFPGGDVPPLAEGELKLACFHVLDIQLVAELENK